VPQVVSDGAKQCVELIPYEAFEPIAPKFAAVFHMPNLRLNSVSPL